MGRCQISKRLLQTFGAVMFIVWMNNYRLSIKSLLIALSEIHEADDIFIAPGNHRQKLTSGGAFVSKSEEEVFRDVLSRASLSLQTCNSIKVSDEPVQKEMLEISNATLPELGIINALSSWLTESKSMNSTQSSHINSVSWIHNLTCAIPPEKMCNSDGFTVIFMSHSLERLQTLESGVRKVSQWRDTREIVLVWNSDPQILQESHKFAKLLNEYHDDPSHPLRIFYSLENGLENNLFNRYHPLIAPKMEAILYFDDDGPFFEEHAISAGFELWKRNSGRQVGCFPRNILFTSADTIKKGVDELEKSIKEVEQGLQTENSDPEHPNFVPICQSESLKYNYYTFANYQAHMLLPSGSFLHRNFLCWLWHPAFEEVRQFILDHPTHPDDMTVSAIISHITGKAPRTFSRRIRKSRRRRALTEQIELKRTDWSPFDYFFHADNLASKENTNSDERQTMLREELHTDDEQHNRNLLWQQENWAEMRDDAIRKIIKYFGSINPGSVGWCAGTEYFKTKKRKNSYYCDPEFPDSYQQPWMQENGLGNDEC